MKSEKLSPDELIHIDPAVYDLCFLCQRCSKPLSKCNCSESEEGDKVSESIIYPRCNGEKQGLCFIDYADGSGGVRFYVGE